MLSLFLFSASCKKKNKKCSRGYELEHPVSVYPIKESYNIGDTIWFEINFSDVFNALVTNNFSGEKFNEIIQLKNFDFHRTFISFTKIIDTTINSGSQNTSGWTSFTPIYQTIMTQWENQFGVEYKYNYSNLGYKYKLGIICNQSGKFIYNSWFTHYYPMAEGQLNEQDLTPDCETEIITDIRFPVNKQSNGTYLTNYHLFEQFMNPALENDLNRIKKECFTFIVN